MSAEPSIIEIELCHQVGIFLLKIFYLKIFFSHGQGIFLIVLLLNCIFSDE